MILSTEQRLKQSERGVRLKPKWMSLDSRQLMFVKQVYSLSIDLNVHTALSKLMDLAHIKPS